MTATAEIPLLLKGPLVRQFLAGRKTVTRRLDLKKWQKAKPGDLIWFKEACSIHTGQGYDVVVYSDGTEVRHKWGHAYAPGLHVNMGSGVSEYATDALRSPIHMPKVAARCWAEIEDIREERLAAITNADVWNEGVISHKTHEPGWTFERYVSAFTGAECDHPLTVWVDAWNSINTKPGTTWKDNPLVARIEFRRIER